MYKFCAYKTEADHHSGKHYFKKYFLRHSVMKDFSSEHSVDRNKYPGYNSMYWKLEFKKGRFQWV